MIRVSEDKARAILQFQIQRYTGVSEATAESATNEILDLLRVADQQARWPAFQLKSDGSYCCYHYRNSMYFFQQDWFRGLGIRVRLTQVPRRFWHFPG